MKNRGELKNLILSFIWIEMLIILKAKQNWVWLEGVHIKTTEMWIEWEIAF